MSIIENPREYSSKSPTNIRLDENVKKILQAEAEMKNTTMSEIINCILLNRYSDIIQKAGDRL